MLRCCARVLGRGLCQGEAEEDDPVAVEVPGAVFLDTPSATASGCPLDGPAVGVPEEDDAIPETNKAPRRSNDAARTRPVADKRAGRRGIKGS